MSIAIKIRQIRELKKMSQEELAFKVGVSQVTIGKWEQGTSIRHEYLRKLAETLEVPVDYLLEGKPTDNNTNTESVKNNYIGNEINSNISIEEIFSRIDNLLNIINTKL